jgi:hypothetical protein
VRVPNTNDCDFVTLWGMIDEEADVNKLCDHMQDAGPSNVIEIPCMNTMSFAAIPSKQVVLMGHAAYRRFKTVIQFGRKFKSN